MQLLSSALEAVEKKEVSDRAARRNQPAAIELPTAPIVAKQQQQALPPPTPAVLAARELRQAEQALVVAEAASAAADGECRRAERAVLKLQPLQPAGIKRTSNDLQYFFPVGTSDEEYALRQKELDVLLAAEQRVRAAECALKQAPLDVEMARFEVELAQNTIKMVKQQQQVESHRKAEWKKFEVQQAEYAREREESRVALAGITARVSELESGIDSRRENFDRELKARSVDLARSEWYHSRAEVVQRDADHVWGVGWEDRKPASQKVHRLVGMSPEEIRNVAPCVNQSVTSTDERVALNRIATSPLEY